MQKYLAWIPNVRGRLSFSHIDTSNLPYDNKNYDFKTGLSVVTQERKLNDTSIPRFIRFLLNLLSIVPPFSFLIYLLKNFQSVDSLLNQTGDYVFCFIYRDEPESIKGSVYLIPKKRIEKQSDIGGWDSVAPTIDLLNRLNSDESNTVDYDRLLLSTLEKNSLCHFDNIEIERCGLTHIPEPNIKLLPRSEQKWSKIDGLNTFDMIQTELASQAYYFIKDITHQHQHHHAKTDTILLLHKVDERINRKKNLRHFSHNVINTLYSLILKNRRKLNKLSIHENKGILTYLKSFKQHFCKSHKVKIKDKYFDTGDQLLIDSLDSAINQQHAKKELRKSFISETSIVSLTIFGILLAMSSLLTVFSNAVQSKKWMEGIELSPSFGYIAKGLLEYPHIALTAVISSMLFIKILSKPSDFLLAFPITSDIYRNLYSLKKYLSVSILFCLSVYGLYYGINNMLQLM